jgi:ribosomal protein S3AE
MPKQTKVITRRKKFIEVDVPLTNSKIELISDTLDSLNNKRIKLDLTRLLKGKSIEADLIIEVKNNKAVAKPLKIKLMPYFIKRMIRKRISYVEDSFEAKNQESLLAIKPFLITRKRVSRSVRKTLRNKAKNWIEDYVLDKTNNEIFEDILTNKLQKSLSLILKKTYPLSLSEIRILEIKRMLNPEEIPKIEKIERQDKKKFIDQMQELEEEKKKSAELEIKETQSKARDLEIKQEEKESNSDEEKIKINEPKKEKAKKKLSKKKKEEINSTDVELQEK